MSGQDGSHGTAATQDLYTNYLKAQWVDDGNTANNKLISNPADSLFGTVATSNVVDVNGGYMYPDQISPLQNAVTTFYYDAAKTKKSGIRSTKGTAKVVYFGVGMEMVQSTDVRNDIIKRSWDWFGGVIAGTGNTGSILVSHMGQNYPNPAGNSTRIDLTGVISGMSLEITDISGRTVYSMPLASGTTGVTINTSSFADGIYFYRLTSNGKIVETKKMMK